MPGLFFLLFVFLSKISAKLPLFNINSSLVTVSGLSSGGFMAVQMHYAYSSIIKGAAIFAGGPYACALNDPAIALTSCMTDPDTISLDALILTSENLATAGLIDSLSNLANNNVFLFSGTADSVVDQGVMQKLAAIYENFKANVHTEFTLAAEHSFPTENYGNLCGTLGEPYINICEYNGAWEALQTLYGQIKAPKQSLDANLVAFDQNDYYSSLSSFNSKGYLYVPTSCHDGNSCGLHIALHGCEQTLDDVSEDFVKNIGLNEIAEANDLIILYPQIQRSDTVPYNPKGCWDWWGYSDIQLGAGRYLTQDGVQIDALAQMMKDLGVKIGNKKQGKLIKE